MRRAEGSPIGLGRLLESVTVDPSHDHHLIEAAVPLPTCCCWSRRLWFRPYSLRCGFRRCRCRIYPIRFAVDPKIVRRTSPLRPLMDACWPFTAVGIDSTPPLAATSRFVSDIGSGCMKRSAAIETSESGWATLGGLEILMLEGRRHAVDLGRSQAHLLRFPAPGPNRVPHLPCDLMGGVRV